MQYTKGLTVKLNLWTNILQDVNPGSDGDKGGSSGGTGSILTSFAAGSGSGTSQGSTNPANNTTGGQATTGNTDTSKNSQQGGTQDWRLGLPAELQEDATLRKFSDVPSLAAAYINAQKLIGADKIAIPGKHASEDDWTGVFKKLGLPEKVDQYELKFKEGATLDENFVNDFKINAHKFGILPSQAQKLADWFSDINMTAENKYIEETKQKQAQELDGLKQEWGKLYDANLSRAQLVLKEMADKDTLQYLNDSGLGNDTKLIKLLAKIGSKMYKEAAIVGGDAGGGNAALTKAEAKKTIDSIMAKKDHPYFQKDHPGHKSAVKEVQDLFSKLYEE